MLVCDQVVLRHVKLALGVRLQPLHRAVEDIELHVVERVEKRRDELRRELKELGQLGLEQVVVVLVVRSGRLAVVLKLEHRLVLFGGAVLLFLELGVGVVMPVEVDQLVVALRDGLRDALQHHLKLLHWCNDARRNQLHLGTQRLAQFVDVRNVAGEVDQRLHRLGVAPLEIVLGTEWMEECAKLLCVQLARREHFWGEPRRPTFGSVQVRLGLARELVHQAFHRLKFAFQMIKLHVRRLRRQADLGRNYVRRPLHHLGQALHGGSIVPCGRG